MIDVVTFLLRSPSLPVVQHVSCFRKVHFLSWTRTPKRNLILNVLVLWVMGGAGQGTVSKSWDSTDLPSFWVLVTLSWAPFVLPGINAGLPMLWWGPHISWVIGIGWYGCLGIAITEGFLVSSNKIGLFKIHKQLIASLCYFWFLLSYLFPRITLSKAFGLI